MPRCTGNKSPNDCDGISRKCGVSASYGYLDMPPTKCKRCRKEGMVNQTIKNWRRTGKQKGGIKHSEHKIRKNKFSKRKIYCEVDRCPIQASFGYPGHYRRRCVSHIKEGMITLSNSICEICGYTCIYGRKRCQTCKDKRILVIIDDETSDDSITTIDDFNDSSHEDPFMFEDEISQTF